MVIFAIAGFGFSQNTKKAEAAVNTNLTGYAWSSNIGWIDMSGVTLDTSANTWSGYAWSSNIGWLSYNPVDLTSSSVSSPDSRTTSMPCPSTSTPSYNSVSGAITGFGRFISGGIPTTAGGWGGCVQMDGVSFNSSTNTLTGYAWGGDVVGWVDFSGVGMLPDNGAPMAQLLPASTQLPSTGGDVNLTWATLNVDSCTGVNFDTQGNLNNSTGLPIHYPANTTSTAQTFTYTLNCTRTSPPGSASATATVIVDPYSALTPDIIFNAANNITSVDWSSPVTLQWQLSPQSDPNTVWDHCTPTLGGGDWSGATTFPVPLGLSPASLSVSVPTNGQEYDITCTDNNQYTTPVHHVNILYNLPDFTLSPNTCPAPSSVTLNWTAPTSSQSCSSTNFSAQVNPNAPGSSVVHPIQTTTYSITCSNPRGSLTQSVVENVGPCTTASQVHPGPVYHEK